MASIEQTDLGIDLGIEVQGRDVPLPSLEDLPKEQKELIMNYQ